MAEFKNLQTLKREFKELLILDIGIAIESMKKYIEEDSIRFNDIVIIESRTKELLRLKIHGVADFGLITKITNEIRVSLISLIDIIGTEDLQKKYRSIPNKGYPLNESATTTHTSKNVKITYLPRLNANVREIIKILSKPFLENPFTIIEECIRSANDRIMQKKSEEPTLKGKIIIEIYESENIIKIIDNGIGITEEDFSIAVMSIGNSKKKEIAEEIGKFGIGFFPSIFSIANKMVLKSYHTMTNEGLKILFDKNDFNFQMFKQREEIIGTEIILSIEKEKSNYLRKLFYIEYLNQEILDKIKLNEVEIEIVNGKQPPT